MLCSRLLKSLVVCSTSGCYDAFNLVLLDNGLEDIDLVASHFHFTRTNGYI